MPGNTFRVGTLLETGDKEQNRMDAEQSVWRFEMFLGDDASHNLPTYNFRYRGFLLPRIKFTTAWSTELSLEKLYCKASISTGTF